MLDRWRGPGGLEVWRRWLSCPRRWQSLIERKPVYRWLVVPCAVLGYAPAFLALHHAAGRVAFGAAGFSFVLAAATLAGVSPAVLVALLIQLMNFPLYRLLGLSVAHPYASASIAFLASGLLAVAVGALRALVSRTTAANRRLDDEIRARRAVEDSLDANLRLHSSLIATLTEGVALFDEGDHFVLANAAAESLLGVGHGELLGRRLEEFVHAEPVAEFGGEGMEVGGGHLTHVLERCGGETRFLRITETQMDGNATGSARTLRVLRDITAQSRLERERRELEQYLQRTEALRSLAVMAGGVAHDFNNLLTGVIGGIELGLLRLAKSPADARDCLEDAKRFAMEASELSRKMLAYAGKRGMPLESVDLATEVAQSLRLVSSTIHGRAALVNAIPNDLPPILADPTGLHQVITNLVLNAVEAMREGVRGTLCLGATVCCVGPEAVATRNKHTSPLEGRYVVLSVADSGLGMSAETQARLFEPFFSTKFQGRGMGLAATLGIVRAHRGGIDVESEPGVGTTFRVYWPIAEAAASAAVSRAVAQPVDFSSLTVLLVDDEPAVREVTGLMLRELGCTVLVARGAEDALATFNEAAPRIDLVLLDVTMPEKSGVMVLAEMRQLDPGVRVVLTSGYGVELASDPCAHQGVVGFLPKPHSLASVTAAIRAGVRPSPERRMPQSQAHA